MILSQSHDDEQAAADNPQQKGSLWQRLKGGLGKTRTQLSEGVGNLLLGEKEISDDVLDDLETALITTDVGLPATREIMDKLASRVKRRELNDTVALHAALASVLQEILEPMPVSYTHLTLPTIYSV